MQALLVLVGAWLRLGLGLGLGLGSGLVLEQGLGLVANETPTLARSVPCSAIRPNPNPSQVSTVLSDLALDSGDPFVRLGLW